jgi:hypothetical protein
MAENKKNMLIRRLKHKPTSAYLPFTHPNRPEPPKLNYLAVNDFFWIQTRTYLTSFGWIDLPKKFHFTIASSAGGTEFNLHLTKNTSDAQTKPTISICSIEKAYFNELLPQIFQAIAETMWRPITNEEMAKEGRLKKNYIPMRKIDRGYFAYQCMDALKTDTNLTATIKKKSRCKINFDSEEGIERFARNRTLQNTIRRSMQRLPMSNIHDGERGIFVNPKGAFIIYHSNRQWYRFTPPENALALLHSFADPKLMRMIFYKIKRAMVTLRDAESDVDVPDYSYLKIVRADAC